MRTCTDGRQMRGGINIISTRHRKGIIQMWTKAVFLVIDVTYVVCFGATASDVARTGMRARVCRYVCVCSCVREREFFDFKVLSTAQGHLGTRE